MNSQKINSPIIPFIKRDENKKAFTLVELIVVITILAILSTIGFVSYSSYLSGSRDTNRISQIKAISEWLYLYSTNHTLPTPDDEVKVLSNWTIIAYQWYAWSNVLETITYSTEGVDPKDKTHFSYYLTKDKKHFQLMAFLEEQDNLQTIAWAVDYSKRYPTVYWKKLWILTDINNTPIQEIEDIKTNWLDVATTIDSYIARLKDSEDVIEGTWSILTIIQDINKSWWKIFNSCLSILNDAPQSEDWVYLIQPEWVNPFNVYCDMTTDWGWWTYTVMLAEWTTRNFFKTWNTEKISSITNDISTKGQIWDIWRDEWNKDIFLQCFSQNTLLIKYEIPFIIYWYNKTDIWNLELNEKAWQPLSTTELNASWNWNNYTLNTSFWTSWGLKTMYIIEKFTNKSVFSSYESQSIWASLSWYNDSPAYWGAQEPIDTSDYCVTAIR